MTSIIRRIRRTNKKAAKYQFVATLKELVLIVADQTIHPKAVIVSFQHRRRKISSKERTWEPSFSKPDQCVIVWPEQTAEALDIRTTLYKGPNDESYEDKEWTLVVDEITSKNRRRPIAAVPLNMRLFLHDHPGQSTQLKLKLRPLSPHLVHSSIILLLDATLLLEGFADNMSTTSTLSARVSREASVTDRTEEHTDAAAPINAQAQQEIARISDEMHKAYAKDQKGKGKEDEEKSNKAEAKKKTDSSEGIRPPWRDPNATPVAAAATGRDPVLNQLDKIPTEAFFRVDENSRPQRVPSPPKTLLPVTTLVSPPARSRSPRASARAAAAAVAKPHAPPVKVEGEELLAWCQRVTQPYESVKIMDFTTSFRTGTALLAIIHAYRPDVIGDFDDTVDKSATMSGKKKNVEKALTAAAILGVANTPDDSYILTPDKKEIRLFLERLRRVLEGTTELPTPIAGSDYRISQIYFVSDAEKGVIAEMDKLKESADTFVSPAYRGVTDEDKDLARTIERESRRKFDKPAPGVPSSSYVTRSIDNRLTETPPAPPPHRTTVMTTATIAISPTATREVKDAFASSSSADEDEAKSPSGRSDLTPSSVSSADTMVTVREMTMITTPTLPRKLSSGRQSPTRREELRLKARELLDNPKAYLESVKGTPDEKRREEVRQLLENATTDGATFLIHDENGSDAPIIPAIGAKDDDQFTTPTSTLHTVSSFDRLKRYGSMRKEELQEAIASFAKQYTESQQQPSSSTTTTATTTVLQTTPRAQRDLSATPTRKLKAQWESDVAEVERTTREQETIAEELVRIQAEHRRLQEAARNLDAGSEEEANLVHDMMQLTHDKNALVSKQDYYNIVENLRDAASRLTEIKSELDSHVASGREGYDKTAEEKRKTDDLMRRYLEVLKEKEELTRRVMEAEEAAKDPEEDWMGSLDRRQPFNRGEPVSASRRIAQNVKDWLTG